MSYTLENSSLDFSLVIVLCKREEFVPDLPPISSTPALAFERLARTTHPATTLRANAIHDAGHRRTSE